MGGKKELSMKKYLLLLLFSFFSLCGFAKIEDFYGTWGATNNTGKLITITISEKEVEFNVYQAADNGLIDFDNFPEWMLDCLESELIVISNSALLPHKTEENMAQLKFQPIDATY